MTDLLNVLTEARPTDTELDALWSPRDREARLSRVLAARRPRRTTLPIAAAAVATAVATAATVACLSPLLGSGNAAAADLHLLARSAVQYDGPVLADGTWLHVKSSSVQHDHTTDHGDPVYAHDLESWTSWDGRTLLVDHGISDGTTEYAVIDDHAPASYQDPTPQFSAALPDTADGLLAYLDPRVSGSSSHTEALYEALTELAGSHTLPPATLAAAFEALARLDHVTTSDVVVAGRAGIEVSYDEALTSSTEAYVFDRATGQELSSHDQSSRSDYASTTTLSEVVSSVPATARAAFRAHGQRLR